MQTQKVIDIIRDAEQNYLQGTTKLGKYVSWSMHDTIERIDAYLNSKHTSGETDSLGREKPFFNIVSAAVNVWYRATDIDTKDIRIIPDKQRNTGLALIATVLLKDWMNKARFGAFLNQWGRTLARYGSAVVKFVEKDGELIASVIPWNRFISDPTSFDAIPHIEKFYKTPAQLRRMKEYDQDAVDTLIKELTVRKTIDGVTVDTLPNFIEIYEVHGELDSRLLEKEPKTIEDEDIKYIQQMHVVSYTQTGKEIKDFTLFRGREKRDPYMITHLIEEDGRTLAIGAVEYLFDAQWMQNHTVKNMKDTLDLASKLIFQTSDTTYVGKNVLTAIETGDIFTHGINQPLTRVANDKPDIVALQNFGNMWQGMGRELTSTPDALRGNTLPSGTPYALGQLLSQNSNSLFEIMTENKGLSITDMCHEFILPFLKTKLDNKDEVVAILDEQAITEIDAMYIPNQAIRNHNKQFANDVLSGGTPTPFDAQLGQQAVKDQLSAQGNKRSFKPDELDEKTWKEALKDFEMTAWVEVTNENKDKQAVLTSLSSAFQTVASLAGRPMTPDERMIFSQILQQSGALSPIQLGMVNSQPTMPPQSMQPVQGSMPGGGITSNA